MREETNRVGFDPYTGGEIVHHSLHLDCPNAKIEMFYSYPDSHIWTRPGGAWLEQEDAHKCGLGVTAARCVANALARVRIP